MTFQENGLTFPQVDAGLAQILVQLPDRAHPYDAASRARLFPSLTGGRDPQADAVWGRRMEPKLQAIFRAQSEVVAGDVRRLSGFFRARSLTIPAEHFPAWVHILNQARLTTAARLGLVAEDFADPPTPAARNNQNSLRVIEIYTILLANFLAHTELPGHHSAKLPDASEKARPSGPESEVQVVVHDDPVNLMDYITKVLMAVFAYPEEQAVKLMKEVHEGGRSHVWSGDRQSAERYVEQLHILLLIATVEEHA